MADGSSQAPWRTLEHAASQLSPGDVVILQTGTYEGQAEIRASGTFGKPITFAAAEGAAPKITASAQTKSHRDLIRIYGSYVTLAGLLVESHLPAPGHNIYINGAHWEPPGARWVTIVGGEVSNAPGQGIMVSGNDNAIMGVHIHDNGEDAQFDHGVYVEGSCNVFRDNRVHDNWAHGLQLFRGEAGIAGHNLLERNYVYSNGDGAASEAPDEPLAGIIVASGHPGNVVRNNVVCDNAKIGILIRDFTDDNTVTGNVTCYNRQAGVAMYQPGKNNSVVGNIAYNDTPYAYFTVSGVSSDQNVFFSTSGAPSFVWNGDVVDFAALVAESGQDQASQVTDPQFAGVPASGFDKANAETYSFCNPFIAALCP